MLFGLLCVFCFYRNKLFNVVEYVVGCIMNNYRNNLYVLYIYIEYDFLYYIIVDVWIYKIFIYIILWKYKYFILI